MDRKTGYLANIKNVPPLIFRFQFNPEMLTEKKTYKYEQANGFGSWSFDQTSAASGVVGSALGLYKDVQEIGSLLTATRPLEPIEGELRSFELEFKLDGSVPGPLDDTDHYGGSIKPDLAVLRSFMLPSWDLIDIAKMAVDKKVACFIKPPSCTLNYAGLSVECVMSELTIKHTAFKDDGDPLRADVQCTLKEQTFSTDPVIGMVTRLIDVGKSYNRAGIGTDFLANTPIVGSFV
jgi:contractile injection system tube protein